jgi:hypothetical protein
MTPVGYARAAGGDGAGARALHQADFGKFAAFERLGRGGDRVDPEVGLAALCGAFDEAGIIERPASGISAARVMPPKWKAGLSVAKTPRSMMPGASHWPFTSIAGAAGFRSRRSRRCGRRDEHAARDRGRRRDSARS